MPEYGKKFTCFKCGCKFYDMGKPRPTCPKCGADPSDHKPPLLRAGSGRRSHAPRREEVPEEEDTIGLEDLSEFGDGTELGEEEDLGIEGEEAEEEPEDE